MAQPEKIFTAEEANQVLSQVASLVQQLQGLQTSILQTNRQLDEGTRKLAQGNGYPIKDIRRQLAELTQHQLDLLQAFQSALQQLENLGGILKDLNQGLVDFYGLREGELVLLCWRLGEDQVRFWHTLEEGFAGRRPLQ